MFHKHRWHVIAAQPSFPWLPAETWTRLSTQKLEAKQDRTLVLQKCASCGTVETAELKGVWTLEQIQNAQV